MPADMPGSRGPCPEPYSKQHAALVPEVSRQGGTLGFAHDAGMVYSSPECLVNGVVLDSREVLPKLLQVRGLDAAVEEGKLKQASETCFNFWLAYMAHGAVLVKPEFWDKSPVLSKHPWSPPTLESPKPNERYPDKWVCRLTFWRKEDKSRGGQSDVPLSPPRGNSDPSHYYRKMEERQEPLKEWSCWEFVYAEFNLSTLRTGKYDDEKPGYCLGNGRASKPGERQWIAALKTTRDGMAEWKERDESFDNY